MGETVIEKIIRNNVGKTVKPGDIVTVNVDRVMIHDIFIPFVAEKFEEMGFTKLWDPDKAVLIYDHLVPASQLDDTRHFHAGDAFGYARKAPGDFRQTDKIPGRPGRIFETKGAEPWITKNCTRT